MRAKIGVVGFGESKIGVLGFEGVSKITKYFETFFISQKRLKIWAEPSESLLSYSTVPIKWTLEVLGVFTKV